MSEVKLPREPNKDTGWTLPFAFLQNIQQASVENVALEEVESIALAIESLGYAADPAELARLRDVEKKVKQMIVFQDSDDLDAEQKATFLYAGMQILRDLTKDQ